MFSRLFNLYSKKEVTKGDSSQNWKNNLEDFQAEPSLPVLGEEKIRVIVFRECEKKSDKTLLFDSDAIIVTGPSVACDKTNVKMCKPQVNMSQKSLGNYLGCSPPKYKRIKPSSDIKVLGEMIFGSVAMVYKGSIQKVHLIRTPPQLLMTKVFALRSRSAGVNFCDNEMTSSCSSTSTTPSLNITGSIMSKNCNGEITRSYSNPVYRTNFRRNSGMSSWSLTSSESFNQSYGGHSVTESPCGSLQSRYVRSRMTSLDSTEILRRKSEQSEENRMAYKQQPKIGVGIIFKLWENDEVNNRLFQDFFFSHYTLFESHLQIFRVKIEKSFYLRKNFTDVVLKAVDSFKRDILTLCYSPRIVEPVWLNLMILAEQKHNETVDKFMSSFINLIKRCESKQNNYFLSILLTAVLTHHPSWVATVMPSTNTAKRSYLDKHTSNTLDVLAKCHPYNPMWAQLCDLYGSVNSPRKLSRTIIVGENANLVVELLYLLTYFLRCSEITENDLHIESEDINSYRFTGSSWNGTMFNETGTPNSVRSWIDKVSCVDTSDLVTEVDEEIIKTDLVNIDETVNIYKDNNIFSKDEKPNNKFIENVLQEQVDISHCYCGYLQKLDSSLGGKNLRNLLKSTDKQNLVNLLGEKHVNNINNSKSCKGCRTLEKTIFEQYCDKCKEILNNLSLEIDSVCKYCIVHLEKLREMLHDSSGDNSMSNNLNQSLLEDTGTCCDSVPTHLDENQSITECHKLYKKENMHCHKKASFQCYCCPQVEIQTDNNNACTVITQDHEESDDEFISRERKASDPVDCVPSPKLATKCLLRHSTTSHDSGTEMAYSVSSSCPELDSGDSLNLTRDNSVSSHDNLFSTDTIVGDMDSDYCSVENDQTSTISEVTCFNADHLLNTVCKSTSSTTIKEIYINIDSTTVNPIGSPNESNPSVLDMELDTMNLKEVQLPRIVPTPVQQTKSNTSVAPDLTTFGSSLLAGYCDSYVSDFVLHGTEKLNEEKLAIDLQNSIKYSVLDEQVYDAACVVADTNTWTCEVWNLSRRTDTIDRNTCESLTRKPILASGLVSSMVESTKELWDMDMPAKFCLLHLEEQLKDIYHRSKVLGEYAFVNTKENTSAFIKSLSYRANDVELLKAVCAAHSPHCEDVLP